MEGLLSGKGREANEFGCSATYKRHLVLAGLQWLTPEEAEIRRIEV
jgi:hypothetical protein